MITFAENFLGLPQTHRTLSAKGQLDNTSLVASHLVRNDYTITRTTYIHNDSQPSTTTPLVEGLVITQARYQNPTQLLTDIQVESHQLNILAPVVQNEINLRAKEKDLEPDYGYLAVVRAIIALPDGDDSKTYLLHLASHHLQQVMCSLTLYEKIGDGQEFNPQLLSFATFGRDETGNIGLNYKPLSLESTVLPSSATQELTSMLLNITLAKSLEVNMAAYWMLVLDAIQGHLSDAGIADHTHTLKDGSTIRAAITKEEIEETETQQVFRQKFEALHSDDRGELGYWQIKRRAVYEAVEEDDDYDIDEIYYEDPLEITYLIEGSYLNRASNTEVAFKLFINETDNEENKGHITFKTEGRKLQKISVRVGTTLELAEEPNERLTLHLEDRKSALRPFIMRIIEYLDKSIAIVLTK